MPALNKRKAMLVNDLSEKEQLEFLRAWWSENGRYVIGGVVLGVAILFGWNQWQSSLSEAQIEASMMYEEVMSSVGAGDVEAAVAAAGELSGKHPDSAYTSQARLAMARLYMDKGRDQDAANVLRDLVEAAGDSEVGLIGRLRLAKILLYQDKAGDVVELLADHRDNAFAARFNEVLGDAYVALKSYTEAQAAYAAALTEDRGSQTIDSGLLQLKINDLPAASEVASISEATVDAGQANVEPAADSAAPAPEIPAVTPEGTDDGSGQEEQ
jgi:predicted negative regulator of RcsB-dependent stress response